MLKPTVEELKKLEISSQTYIENGFFIAKLAGVCKWHLSYSIFYFFCMAYGVVTSCGFIYGASLEGEKEAALENLHFIPLILNMGAQAAAYHYNQKEYLDLFRAIDKGFFDYEGTIDEEMELAILQLKTEAKNRKRKFGLFYTMLLAGAHIGQITKKPLNYLITGRGQNIVDGENNLMWETPYGLYVPYAEQWSVYIISTIIAYCACNLTALTAVASVITYQYISEELLVEYAVVSKTFGSCIERAERLLKLMENDEGVLREGAEKSTMVDCVTRCLNLSVKHHVQVLRMTDVFKRLMNIPLFLVVFDGGLVLCISAYLMISEDVSMHVKAPIPSVITAEAVLLLIFCYYGERLTEASQDVGDSIFNNGRWVQHSDVIRPYTLIIKSFCDVPNELSAGGFTSVNHNTFANVLSTAYSYIGFLLST